MEQPYGLTSLNYDTVLHDIVQILDEMLADWDDFSGEIGPDTHLVADLACSSVEIVELVVSVEEHFGRQNLPFHMLLMTPEGGYIDDLQVSQLADFVCRAGDMPVGPGGAG